jgi:hypothetical protein
MVEVKLINSSSSHPMMKSEAIKSQDNDLILAVFFIGFGD